MLFNSFSFLVFFPIVVTILFALPQRYRAYWLLAASYVFYMAWDPRYIVLILASTLLDYGAARAIGASNRARVRALWLCASITLNLGLLFAFKYFNFFSGSAAYLAEAMGRPFLAPHLEVLLPVGISFYTFQTMSYTIDVYRGALAPERNLVQFALYVAYFPQLVAGPIERAQHLLPQLRAPQHFEYARAREGLLLMLWGMFKKVVVAGQLAEVVDRVYTPHTHDFFGPTTLLATVFFAFQIYCDFSGYSDIAIGAARVMGVNIMWNFDRPYLAHSFGEFWQRWHISLSTWFRDYLYIPLGGNRQGPRRWAACILAVFLVSGFWHGANWTFLVWGMLHGMYYLTERLAERYARLVPRWLRGPGTRRLVVFAGVCLAWIFFRSHTLYEALRMIRHLPDGWSAFFDPVVRAQVALTLATPKSVVLLDIALIALTMRIEGKKQDSCFLSRVTSYAWWLRWPVYIALSWGILNLSSLEEQPFIYFQF